MIHLDKIYSKHFNNKCTVYYICTSYPLCLNSGYIYPTQFIKENKQLIFNVSVHIKPINLLKYYFHNTDYLPVKRTALM